MAAKKKSTRKKATKKRATKKTSGKARGGQAGPQRRECGTMSVHYRMMREVSGYAERRASCENDAWRAARNPLVMRSGCTKIPVVVHVVYKTAAQNISDAQVHSQIDVLNEDYRMRNADVSSVPAAFQPFTADARIQFELATTDPDGNPTTGITRTATTRDSFTDDDGVKSAASGGADAWPADQYLNIWVCNLVPWLGYAQFPGGPASTDGVVILHTAFGTTGTAAAPFNLGRTATHEVGHWLNLFHIWGDDAGGCSGSDHVADTPNQGGPNFGTPTFPTISCGNAPNGDMFMNYMDYVDDAAMVMFSAGQVQRMQATLDGARSTVGTSTPCEPKSKFEPDVIKKLEPEEIKKHEPDDIKKHEPDVKKREPDIKKREPEEIKKHEPDTKKHEPDIKKLEPEQIKKHEPDTKKHEPDIKKLEPEQIKKFEPDKKREPEEIKKFEPDKTWAEGPGGKNIVEGPGGGVIQPGGGVMQPGGGGFGVRPDAVGQIEERLARLENAVAQLTHFIRSEQRPDTGRAPLRNESDSGDD